MQVLSVIHHSKLINKIYLLIIVALFLFSTTIFAKPQSQVITEYMNSKNWVQADKELTSYLKKNPEKKWAYSSHAWVLENLKRYNDGIVVCELGLKEWPTDAKLKKRLARLLIKKSENKSGKEVLVLLKRAYLLAPEAHLLFRLAKGHRALGNFDKAIQLMQKGIKKYPNYKYFSDSLIYTRYLAFKKDLKAKDHLAIKKHIRKAVSWMDPKLPIYKQIQYLYILRFGLREVNDPPLFEKAFAQLIKRFKNDPMAYDEYGFQLYANHRLFNPFDPVVKKKAIKYRRKAFSIYWKKYAKPKSIRNLAFPLKGANEVWSSFGGTAMTHNGLANYCYDFVAVDQNGKIKKPGSTGKEMHDYYMFGKPIFAVADGTVVSIVDKYPDNKPGAYAAVANTITLDHGKYDSFYAHNKFRSIVVKEGQKIKRGQLLGAAGNSGMSVQPHLHFCLYNKNKERASVPFEFKSTRIKKPSGKVILSNKPYQEDDIVIFE